MGKYFVLGVTVGKFQILSFQYLWKSSKLKWAILLSLFDSYYCELLSRVHESSLESWWYVSLPRSVHEKDFSLLGTVTLLSVLEICLGLIDAIALWVRIPGQLGLEDLKVILLAIWFFAFLFKLRKLAVDAYAHIFSLISNWTSIQKPWV